MKVRPSAKPMCKDCYVHRRRNGKGKIVVRVGCRVNPKHKQRQG